MQSLFSDSLDLIMFSPGVSLFVAIVIYLSNFSKHAPFEMPEGFFPVITAC